jgi:hypothetical protein
MTARNCISENKYTLNTSYKCNLKEHDDLQKLPLFIEDSIKNLTVAFDNLSAKNPNIKQVQKDNSETENFNIDPVIRLTGKSNGVFHFKQKVELKGEQLKKLTKKLCNRVIEVKNQLRIDIKEMKDREAKKIGELKRQLKYMHKRYDALTTQRNSDVSEEHFKFKDVTFQNEKYALEIKELREKVKKLKQEKEEFNKHDFDHEFAQILKIINDTHGDLWDNSSIYKQRFPKDSDHSATVFLKYMFDFFNYKIKKLKEESDELANLVNSQFPVPQFELAINGKSKSFEEKTKTVNGKS